MDNKIANEIKKIIADMFEVEFKKYSTNTEFVYDGIITKDEESDNLLIEVRGERYPLDDGSVSQTGIKNYSGIDLLEKDDTGNYKHINDAVRIYAKGNKMNNAYVGIAWTKKEQE